MRRYMMPLLALTTMLNSGCGSNEAEKAAQAEIQQTSKLLNERKRKDKELEALNEDYGQIPDTKILEDDGASGPLYAELKQRYKNQLAELKQKIEGTGAKLIVVIIPPDVGREVTNLSRYGHPFIKASCSELGLEAHDFSAAIAAKKPEEISQVPRDKHWSKAGAVFLAGQLEPILKKYESHRSTATYKDAERPETFGDLEPSSQQVVDGGVDLSYKLVTNSQGLRMDHDVKFPKTKQHVLFLGGSQIYSPFLDNEFIATTLLQQKFPNMEIMNAGMISGCTDDFLSLWDEKAKYSEPDVVIMQTNGTDITDLYFTNRNHLARSKNPYPPTNTEEKFFREKYRK